MVLRSVVATPVFTFVTASSTPTRGLATMHLVSASRFSIGMPWLVAHVVIPVFINIASTMISFLIYGSAFQIIAVCRFGVIVPAALLLTGAAM